MRDAKGKLHSCIGVGPDGCDVEQTMAKRQIIQRCRYPDGRLIISYFQNHEGIIRKVRGDVIFHLHRSSNQDS